MISAIEARAKAKKVLEQGLSEELQDIAKEIDTAINNGKYQLSKTGILSQSTVTVLSAKGYEIQNGNQYNEPYYIIRW